MQQHSVSLLASTNDHMMWCGDFNRHHPLWDEEWNSHLFMAGMSAATQPLIDLLEDYDMVMLLPKGIPMLQSMAMKNWTRVDNVFATYSMECLVVVCDTDPRLHGPGTDHMPILMALDLEVLAGVVENRRNFRAMDWLKFQETLAEQLATMPDPCTLLDKAQFQRAADDLTVALQAAIKLTVPMSKPSPHSCCWWNEDLSQLKKEMNRLGGASYKYCAIADHLLHSQYKEIWSKYGSAIKQAKKQHWDNFLEGLSSKDLWMAQ